MPLTTLIGIRPTRLPPQLLATRRDPLPIDKNGMLGADIETIVADLGTPVGVLVRTVIDEHR